MSTFRKAERLHLKRDIENLFSPQRASGNMICFPLRAVWCRAESESGAPVQVLVSVSKRRLRHAVDRNRAKRQIREAYRLQKHVLTDALPAEKRLHVAFIWVANGAISSPRVHSAVRRVLEKIREGEEIKPTKVEVVPPPIHSS